MTALDSYIFFKIHILVNIVFASYKTVLLKLKKKQKKTALPADANMLTLRNYSFV